MSKCGPGSCRLSCFWGDLRLYLLLTLRPGPSRERRSSRLSRPLLSRPSLLDRCCNNLGLRLNNPRSLSFNIPVLALFRDHFRWIWNLVFDGQITYPLRWRSAPIPLKILFRRFLLFRTAFLSRNTTRTWLVQTSWWSFYRLSELFKSSLNLVSLWSHRSDLLIFQKWSIRLIIFIPRSNLLFRSIVRISMLINLVLQSRWTSALTRYVLFV